MSAPAGLRTVQALRYVSPLREGGSLPGLMEADDEGLYVVKLRGAGQGPLALVSEVVVGELARALELPAPELVVVDVDAQLADAEPDREIQDLVRASGGENLGVDFLPQALSYTRAGALVPSHELAAAVVWLDAFTENVDRTARNPNLLVWHRRLWLIDHGAALYRQHAGLDPQAARGPFAAIGDHVLLPVAGSIVEADARLAPLVTETLLRAVLAQVPAGWLAGVSAEIYVTDLLERLRAPRAFVGEAERARRA